MKEKKVKAVYLSIISFVTVICIVMGWCYHAYQWGGGIFSIFSWYDSGKTELLDNGELGNFSGISVKSDVMDVTVEQGDGYSISYKSSREILPEYEIEDGVLTVSQKKHKWKWNAHYTCKVTITVPHTASLEAITLDSDCGNMQLNNIRCNSLHAKADVGDVKVRDSFVGDVVVTADVGTTKFEDCTFSSMRITSDVGDVKVIGTGDLSGYGMDLYADVGSVKVNGEKQRSSYYREGDGTGQIKISSDCGSIHVSE